MVVYMVGLIGCGTIEDRVKIHSVAWLRGKKRLTLSEKERLLPRGEKKILSI